MLFEGIVQPKMKIYSSSEIQQNLQVIHMTPVHQFMSCELKSYAFVRNKSFIKEEFHCWQNGVSIKHFCLYSGKAEN